MATEEQADEIYEVLKKHPTGISSEKLWEQCSKFTDRLELAKVLHHLSNISTIYKKGLLYFLVDTNSEAANQSAKRLERFQRVDSSVLRSNTEAVKKQLKTGDLQRSKGMGGAAWVIYTLRNSQVSFDDLVKLTGCSRTSLSTSLTKLVSRGYIIKSGPRLATTYKWSGEYLYPFPSASPDDKNLLAVDINDFLKDQASVCIPIQQVNEETVKESSNDLLRLLDLQIESTTHQLAGLKLLREQIVNSK